jgi:hypothetical protein
MHKPRATINFNVNRLKVRIPWFIEVESEGIIPVVGALLICLVVVGWIVLREGL